MRKNNALPFLLRFSCVVRKFCKRSLEVADIRTMCYVTIYLLALFVFAKFVCSCNNSPVRQFVYLRQFALQ